MKRLVFVFLLCLACRRPPAVPLDRQLWRVDGPWKEVGNSLRTAPATILVFRGSHEFVELHCTLIERPDATVYILARAPRIAVVGQWTQRASEIDARRSRVARMPRLNVPKDPVCEEARLTFRISGNSVSGNAGTYSPITRLVAPEFETFVNAARQSAVTCGGTEKGR